MDNQEINQLEKKIDSWIEQGWKIYIVPRNSADIETLKKKEISFEEFERIKKNEYFLLSPSSISYPVCKDEIETDYTKFSYEEYKDEKNLAKEIIDEIFKIKTNLDKYSLLKEYLSKF